MSGPLTNIVFTHNFAQLFCGQPGRTTDLFHFCFKGEDYRHVFRSSRRDMNWCALALMLLLECTTCNVWRTAAVFTMAQRKSLLVIFWKVFMNSFPPVEKSSKFVNILLVTFSLFYFADSFLLNLWKFKLNTNKAFYGEHRTTRIWLCSAPSTCVVYHAASNWWC